jgi:hypothetical protein
MSNSPFDTNSPLFPWNLPPPPRERVSPPLSGWVPSAPPTPSLANSLTGPQLKSPPPLGDYLANYLAETKRPRIFASYQHATDQYYYNEFSRIFHDTHECVYDSSLDTALDSDDHDYIKQRIRDEFIAGTSCTVVLVGPTSYQRKHIDWEIKATLDKQHALIGVQLPNLPLQPNNTVIVPDRLHSNIKSGYALWLTWQQVIASAANFTQYVTDASNRSKALIVNPKDIKKQDG